MSSDLSAAQKETSPDEFQVLNILHFTPEPCARRNHHVHLLPVEKSRARRRNSGGIDMTSEVSRVAKYKYYSPRRRRDVPYINDFLSSVGRKGVQCELGSLVVQVGL